jgi:hypothetical protein
MAYGTINADVIGTSVANTSLGAGDASLMKNRIINGAMVIDQRNAGAAVTQTASGGVFDCDRWNIFGSVTSKFSSQQVSTAPAGFVNSSKVLSLSAYSSGASEQFIFRQLIEGYNVADLGWGTASAKTITVSFWAQSSLTGTFGGSVLNSDASRCYPFSFSLPVANTWTQISVTIAGDTTGTWLTTNGIGINLTFNMGSGSSLLGTAGSWGSTYYTGVTGNQSIVGTNGATFYITGVQLEVGSSATGYEYVNYQTSLANCQRYCYTFSGAGGYSSMPLVGLVQVSGNLARLLTTFPVTMRTAPSLTPPAANTIIIQGPSGTNYTPTALALATSSAQTQSAFVDATVSGAQANYACIVFDNNTSNSKFIFSAEL